MDNTPIDLTALVRGTADSLLSWVNSHHDDDRRDLTAVLTEAMSAELERQGAATR